MIELLNISKIYGSGDARVIALDKISLKIEKGDYVALLGKSGSGKSTLLNILGFLDSPSSGTYCFDNNDVSNLNQSEHAFLRNRNIGFIFQNFHLLPRATAFQNVILPLQYRGTGEKLAVELGMHALKRVGLINRAKHFPNELSGGQRQRVAIARALVTTPSLLIADEPTGNLDSETADQIMELFSEIHEDGNTIVMVTHDYEIASHCTRKIQIADGVIVNTDLKNY